MKKVLVAIICLLSVFCLNVNAAKKTKTKATTKAPEVKENLPKVVEGKEKIKVYVFHKDGCPYCQKAITFLQSIEDKYGKYFELVTYEVYDAEWNIEDKKLYNLMNEVAEELGTEVNGVPYIVIGKTYNINGYDEATTGTELKAAIVEAYTDENYVDLVAQLKTEIDNAPDDHASDGWIIGGISLVLVGGIAALIICSRKKTK